MRFPTQLTLLPLLTCLTTGCGNENRELARMAERHVATQAEQNRNMADLQRDVTQATRDLVQADAEARKEIVVLHQEVQQERSEIGRQRDALETDRKQLAAERHRDSLTASALVTLGWIIACVLPLVLCWYLLQRPTDAADDLAVAELLLDDLTASKPVFLRHRDAPLEIEHQPPKKLPGSSPS